MFPALFPVLIVNGDSIGDGDDGELAPPFDLMRAFEVEVGSLNGTAATIALLEDPCLSASASTASSMFKESCRKSWTARFDDGSRTLPAGRGRTGSDPLMLSWTMLSGLGLNIADGLYALVEQSQGRQSKAVE